MKNLLPTMTNLLLLFQGDVLLILGYFLLCRIVMASSMILPPVLTRYLLIY